MARRWTREHEDQVKRILALMSREATPFTDMSPEAVKARRQQGFAAWFRTYLPHWALCEDAPFHAAADARRNQLGIPVCECWARGTAKTTRYSITDPLYDICNEVVLWRHTGDGSLRYEPAWWGEEQSAVGSRQSAAGGWERVARLDFIILGAKTLDAAAAKADIIRLELKHNARLRCDYGDAIAPSTGDDQETDFEANGCRVRCIGTGQSLRSAVHNGHRPQKFIGDDLEDKRIARSREQEEKLRDWLMGDVFPALEGAGQEAVFRNLCNMYGRHCLAKFFEAQAAESDEQGRPLAEYHVTPLLTDEGETAWPARYTTAQVKRAMAIIGSVLARSEYLCKVADELAPFQPKWFRTFDVRTFEEQQVAA